MASFIAYQLKVAILLAVFFLLYKLLLRKQTFFRLNRVLLLSITILSLVLPLCVITIYRTVPDDFLKDTFANMGLGAKSLSFSHTWFPTALGILYLCGFLYVLIRILISLTGVVWLIRKGYHHWEEDGSHIVLLDKPISPFSWLAFIVLSLDDYREDQRAIVEHEKIHIDYRHSVDVLLIDLVSVFQWFNPIVWLLKSELCAQHEYEVDKTMIARGVPSRAYQHLLIEKAMKVNAFFVTNHINDSNLKNRIQMMNAKKTDFKKAFRALYVVPLICLSLLATAQTEYVLPESSPDSLKIKLNGAQKKPILVIDDVEHPYETIKSIEATNIKTVTLLPDSLALVQYGERAKNGVVVIKTK